MGQNVGPHPRIEITYLGGEMQLRPLRECGCFRGRRVGGEGGSLVSTGDVRGCAGEPGVRRGRNWDGMPASGDVVARRFIAGGGLFY